MANNYKYIGHNYTTPDLVAKVTGKARYAEDHRAEGMLFIKLLLSPMPHARVVSVDDGAALAHPGVKAILRASDFPVPPPPPAPPGQPAPPPPPLPAEIALTDEPVYQGEPILAIAAVDESTAAEAIELLNVVYEPLPFCVDPLDSLRPGGANARTQGNVYTGAGRELKVVDLKWSDGDFAEAAEGRLPMGEAPDTFSFGDLEAGFKAADLILDETILSQGTGHQPLETRTAMAYWQNGKLYLHGSTQSVAADGAEHRPDGRPQAGRGRPHQRVHRRRLRQQDPGRAQHGDPGADGQEDRHAGDDAHHSRGGALHRPGPRRHPGPRPDRLPQGRQDPGDGLLHPPGQRALQPAGRLPFGGRRWPPSTSSPRPTGGAASPCSPTPRRAPRSVRPAACR